MKSRVELDDRQKSRLQSSSFLPWKEYYKILVLYRRKKNIHYRKYTLTMNELDVYFKEEDQRSISDGT